MKANFKHAEKEIVAALCLTDERLTTILQNAQTNMMKKYPQGSKTKFLEFVIEECKDVNEVICATIEWKGMMDHMQRVAMQKTAASKIIKPNGGREIIKPNEGRKIIKPLN